MCFVGAERNGHQLRIISHNSYILSFQRQMHYLDLYRTCPLAAVRTFNQDVVVAIVAEVSVHYSADILHAFSSTTFFIFAVVRAHVHLEQLIGRHLFYIRFK